MFAAPHVWCRYLGPMDFFAHRGSSRRFAEHTRAAYLQALADGADGLECDVQFTADKQLVLWHDATVDRTSDGSGALLRKTLAELRELDVFSWREPVLPNGFGSPAEQLLTLPELLDIAADASRPITLLIEFKHPSPFGHDLEGAVLHLLRERGWDASSGLLGQVRIQFMSFTPSSSEYLVGAVPARDLMFLLDEVSDAKLVKDLAPALEPTPDVVAQLRELVERGKQLVDDGIIGGVGPSLRFVRAHPDRVRGWVEAGRTVRVWTVNTPDDVALCRDLGVTQVTSDLAGRLAEPSGRFWAKWQRKQ